MNTRRVKRAATDRPPHAVTGQTPLDYMLAVMRDESADAKRRDSMAKAAAPFVHARLGSVEAAGRDDAPVAATELSELEAARRVAFLLTKAARQVEKEP